MAKKSRFAIAVVMIGVMAGCATSPWHGNLMSNNQLIAADCQQLTMEERRVSENIQHLNEASSGGTVGAVILAVLEGLGGTSGTASANSANLADQHSQQAAQLENRKSMIATLRSKKGCV